MTGNRVYRDNILRHSPVVTYDGTTGNIVSRSDLGYTFSYGENKAGPHALTSISGKPAEIPETLQNITYTDTKKVKKITQGNKSLEIAYGYDGNRCKEVYTADGKATTRYFGNNLEEEHLPDGTVRTTYYLYAGSELFGLYIHNYKPRTAAGRVVGGEPAKPPATGPLVDKWDFYYAQTDLQGSLIALKNSDGTLAQRYAYDAWGKRRNPNYWEQPDKRDDLLVSRGYTMHQHLDAFGLINMNGRMYDPVVGMFLSPDPYIQAPGNWLNYNRYSYCLNNPLMYTDPSGEIAWFIPAIIGAVLGGVSGYMTGNSAGAKGWDMAGYIAGGALIGGLSGGTASGVSALGGAAYWAGASAGVVAGAGFSGLATGWNGKSMFKGGLFGGLSGFLGGGVGAAIGGSWGAIAGGAASSGLNTALSGGSLEQVGLSMLAGGAMAYGAYELTSYIAYKQADLGLNGYKLNYNQFKTMQAEYQRSRFWRKEYGGVFTKDGGVVRVPADDRFSMRVKFDTETINAVNAKGGKIGTYHTHWAKGGNTYHLNSELDIVSKANSVRTETVQNGVSSQDHEGIAKNFRGNQFLIDRSMLYMYSVKNTYTNNSFLLRYSPMYWLWLNK